MASVNHLSTFLDILLIFGYLLIGFTSAEPNYGSHRETKETKNVTLSSSLECARDCQEGEPPKICYYSFNLELYPVLGGACNLCLPNETNPFTADCQCVTADGFERVILTVNRMLPGPSIQVCKGDKIVVDVSNHMEGMENTIHWHGIFQNGSQYYDGVPFVTQCPIPHGSTFRYQFIAGNDGTFFWHAHTGLQKMDGIYGSLIVRTPDSEEPNRHLYDYDLKTHVLLISDIMHEQATERFPGLLKTNPGQTPASLLVNGKGQYTDPVTGVRTNTPMEVFTVTQGRKYRFRMINAMSSVCFAELRIYGHPILTLIATDGGPVHPKNFTTVVSLTGERYDFVLNANQPRRAYWIHVRGLGECAANQVEQWAILKYAGGPDQPDDDRPSYNSTFPQGVVLNPPGGNCTPPQEGAVCVNQLKNARPVNKAILKAKADKKFYLPIGFDVYNPQQLYEPDTYRDFLITPTGTPVIATIDNISYISPTSPPLSQIHDIPPEQFCNRENRPANCGTPCICTHILHVSLNDVIDFIFLDTAAGIQHPIHLHGYAFNVMGMGKSPDKNVTKMSIAHARDLDNKNLLQRNFRLPPTKDTIMVPNGGYTVIRFLADNPGYWLLHCHILFHIVVGMDLIVHVGTAEDLPPVPPKFPTCKNFVPSITPPGDEGCY